MKKLLVLILLLIAVLGCEEKEIETDIETTYTCDSLYGFTFKDLYIEDFNDILVEENNVEGWETSISDWFDEEGYITRQDGCIAIYSGDGVSSIAKYFDSIDTESNKLFVIEFKFANYFRSRYAEYGMGGNTILYKNSEFEIAIGDLKINIRPGTDEEYWSNEDLFNFSDKDLRIIVNLEDRNIIGCFQDSDISNEFTCSDYDQNISYVEITSSKAPYDLEPYHFTTNTVIDYLNIYSVD